VSAPSARADDLLAVLTARNETVAIAESLTGGLLCSTLVDAEGASQALRGGVVAYATELKSQLLDVDADLLRARGPVDPDVAVAMAEGVRRRLRATWGLSTTGVAGPEPQDGVPPGTVCVAVVGPGGSEVRELRLTGGRLAVRAGSVAAALNLLDQAMAGFPRR
jgi:nicotinamide-nucleotide amidase